MVKVETYFKVGDEFVPLLEFTGHISDPVYVEGSIELEMDGVKVLPKELWDDVNWLWAYIINGLTELTTQAECLIDFPDQPIELSFRIDARWQRMFVELRLSPDEQVKASASYDEFMAAMSEAAQQFFRRMAELIPEERADWERELHRTQQLGIPTLQQR